MEYKEAIERLIDHFAVHDDGRPHPKLDEAVELAITAMEEKIRRQEAIERDGRNLWR